MNARSTPAAAASAEEPLRDPDPFDPAALRLTPDFEAVGVKRVLTAVSVRKPGRQEFFRTHPGEDHRLETGLVEFKEDREFYLVHPDLRLELAEEMILVRLHLAVSRAGSVFLWPVRLPGPDGKRNPWHDSAEKAALLATRQWVRLVPNQAAGAYDTYAASAALPEPEWPELGLRELLELAFGERFVASVDHPVVRRLRGLA
jgi:hypothetical protein